MTNGKAKYKAFISYSHQDKAVAKWLHHKLDGYLPPSNLGNGGAGGPTRKTRASRWRVFLDDEEFGAAGSLSDRIRASIAASESLIVVCSTDAARSTYVDDEIKLFKQIHGSTRVLAMIANGKPHDPTQECFPKALKTAFDPDGAETGTDEPIAADLQVFDRRQVANKMIAGVLGVGYGDFVDRENARRVRRILWTGGISGAVVILLVAAGAVAVLQAREAARNLADSFIQRGQRAAAAFNLSEAQGWFRKALAVADSILARSGLIGTLEPPITLEREWWAAPVAQGKRPELTSVSFIDDVHIAVGDKSGRLHVVDLRTGAERWTRDLGGAISAVSFARARNQIGAGLKNGKVVWLAVEDGAAVAETDLSFPILSLRHDRDGRSIAVGMEEPGGVVVLDEEGKRVFELQHEHAGSVQGTAFNRTGETMYWGGSGAYIWACALKGGCDRVTRVEDWVYSVDGSADTRFTAYAAGGKIEFFDHAMRMQQILSEANEHIFALRFDPSSRYLATAGSDRTISIYDVRAQRKLFAAPAAHQRDIYAIEFSPDGDRLVAVGLDGRATIWRVFEKGAALPPHGFEPSGPMLVATQRNRISEIRIVRENTALVRTWDQQDRFVKIDPKLQDGRVPSGAESQDRLAMSLDLARTLAFRASEFSLVKVWSGESGEPPRAVTEALALGDPEKQVIALSRDRKVLAVVASDGRAQVFDRGGVEARAFGTGDRTVRTGALMPASNLLLVGHSGGGIAGYDVRSGAKRLEAKCGDEPLLYLLEDRARRRIIAVTRSGPICLLDTSGNIIAQSGGIAAEAIALSPDESMLASAGLEGEVILMSAFDLSEIMRFRGHRGAIHALHFTLDSKHLVSGGADETLRVWPAAEARRIATAPIGDLRRDYPSQEAISSSVDTVSWLRGHR